MPASITGDTNPADLCEAGEASGLLSWVMKGIEDAVTNRADVISSPSEPPPISPPVTAPASSPPSTRSPTPQPRPTSSSSPPQETTASTSPIPLRRTPRPVPRRPQHRRLHQPGLRPRPSLTRLLQQLRLHSQRPRRARRQLPQRCRHRRQRLDPWSLQLRQTRPHRRPPPPTPTTASAASTSATPPMFRPSAPAPPHLWPLESPLSFAPPTRTGVPPPS
jgi:hypothetical protein